MSIPFSGRTSTEGSPAMTSQSDEGNQQKGLAAFLKENGIGEAVQVLLLRGLYPFVLSAKFVKAWQGVMIPFFILCL